MDLIKVISKKLNEPILSLNLEGGGWYTIIREYQPESTRYSFAIRKTLNSVTGLIHDRKRGVTTPVDISQIKTNLKALTQDAPENIPQVNSEVLKILNKGVIGDANKYLENAGLLKFLKSSKPLWRSVKNKNGESWIIVPYYTFDTFPEPVGANAYKGKGGKNKRFLKGRYGGAFHPHKMEEGNKLWILGEGFLDCFLAASVTSYANVLEVGGVSKYKNVIKTLLLKSQDKIVLLGEKDVKEELEKLKEISPLITIVYPPKEKDFSDFYLKNPDIEVISDIVLGEDVSQSGVKYKPLGIEEENMVVYSKIIGGVVKVHPDKTNSVIRQCIASSGFESWSNKDKQKASSQIYEACVNKGLYQTDKTFALGMYGYKNRLYFNTGVNLYDVTDKTLIKVRYRDVISNDFLIVKSDTTMPAVIDSDFNKSLIGVDDALRSCDWEFSFYGAILLGFLAQSVYAGVNDFRPHLWIFSNGSSAGKSWISDWVTTHLLPIAKKRESSKSSEAGTRQVMKNNAVLIHCDELGERGSVYQTEIKQMIELFRSACTSTAPVLLGTKEQNPIKQRLRFSALVSVIDGRSCLEEQDYYRFLFLNLLVKDKLIFNNEILPKFRALENRDTLGFLKHCLLNYDKFQEYQEYFRSVIREPIRHRVRGLAAIFAGYAMLYGDLEKGKELYQQSKEDVSMYEEYYSESEDNDFVSGLMNKLVPTKYLGLMTEKPMLLEDCINKDLLRDYGIYMAKNSDDFYINCNKSVEFFCDICKINIISSSFRRMLVKSDLYLKETVMSFKSGRVRVLKFKLPSHVST